VSDRPYLVGHKSVGDLSYVTRNSVRNVSFIAIDPKAKLTAVAKLKLLRIERRVVSVLTKQPNGLFKYESRSTESVLGEQPFSIGAAGAKLALATQTPGNFSYAIRDEQGLNLARVDYSVAGTGNVSRSLDRNAELQLSLNKKDYDPGEEIEISIRAPYAGAGLITIERDKVFTHKWFRAGVTSSVQKIALPKDFEGNGYVSVQFARDPASDEIYMSPMSHGVVPFVTSLARRTNPLTLKAPAMVKPGQPVKITLTAKAPARAIVFAVDEGILQVARYQNPDPLKFFFQKKALEVKTQQTLDLILPEFKKLMSGAAPGGDAEGMLGKNLNPFKRKTDKPVVYWSGIVEVNGSMDFTYTPPENFNGSLRIMAIAINDDTASSAATATTVRGDLVLLPNVPVAMTPGDEVEIGIGVANNANGSGKDAPVTVALAVSGGLEVVGAKSQVLKISERSEGQTKFMVRAKPGEAAQLGSASVIFTAQLSAASARLSTDVSVRPASTYVTLVQTGTFRGNGDIGAQGNFYSNFQRSELAVSSSPWAYTSGLLQYLDVYPHGCTEQITSQVFPAVLIGTQPALAKELLKRPGANGAPPDVRKSLERYLALVRARQGADGGFSMWPGGGSDLFATTYVTNLLVEAKDRKLGVPNDMLQKANNYLQAQVGQNASSDYDWRIRAQAAYLLTRQGVQTNAALTNLRDGAGAGCGEPHHARRGAGRYGEAEAVERQRLQPVLQLGRAGLRAQRAGHAGEPGHGDLPRGARRQGQPGHQGEAGRRGHGAGARAQPGARAGQRRGAGRRAARRAGAGAAGRGRRRRHQRGCADLEEAPGRRWLVEGAVRRHPRRPRGVLWRCRQGLAGGDVQGARDQRGRLRGAGGVRRGDVRPACVLALRGWALPGGGQLSDYRGLRSCPLSRLRERARVRVRPFMNTLPDPSPLPSPQPSPASGRGSKAVRRDPLSASSFLSPLPLAGEG
jgi:uncharacterized protein YfaS (alpha-2-macroglobulin family)